MRSPGRPVRWSDDDRLALFDSIAHGYPIGTLSFQRGVAEGGLARVGRLAFDVEPRTDALWVIDGYQRIVALVEALACPDDEARRVILFDLDAGEFVWKLSFDAQLRLIETTIPASLLLDRATLLRRLSTGRITDTPGALGHILEVSERVREHRIATCTVEARDAETLGAIFARANFAGVRPTDVDVFYAHNPPNEATVTLADAATAVVSMGWTRLSDEIVLDVMRALEGRALKSTAVDLDPRRMSVAVPRAARALIAAVDFLKERAGIVDRYVGLSTPLLAVLARFFDAFGSPSARSVVLLRRWLWRSLAYSATTGQLGGRSRSDTIVAGDEHGSVQRLLATVSTTPPPTSFDLPRLDTDEALVAQMAEWGADDSPPLAALAPDEAEDD